MGEVVQAPNNSQYLCGIGNIVEREVLFHGYSAMRLEGFPSVQISVPNLHARSRLNLIVDFGPNNQTVVLKSKFFVTFAKAMQWECESKTSGVGSGGIIYTNCRNITWEREVSFEEGMIIAAVAGTLAYVVPKALLIDACLREKGLLLPGFLTLDESINPVC